MRTVTSAGFFSLCLFIIPPRTSGQITFTESFGDGDFTSDPPWNGSDSTWFIAVNSDVAGGATNSFTLRLNKLAPASGIEYISTQRTNSWGISQSWSFWMGRRAQSATDANQSVMWLWASEADLTSASIDGYRIRFGDDSGQFGTNDDEIILQRVDDGVPTNILLSSGAIPNGSTDVGFMIRVTRSSSSEWNLYTSTLPTSNGMGVVATDIPDASSTLSYQGTVTDPAYTDFAQGYFGFMAVHSSSAAARAAAEFDQFFFDTSAFSPLPVELASFRGHVVDNADIHLEWTTVSEVNNYGFYIQERNNGITEEWNDMPAVFIPGNGTTTEPHYYEHLVLNMPAGSYDYRLRQVDLDGSQSYSPVVSVNVESPLNTDGEAVPAVFALHQNFPNPFNPSSSIRFTVHASLFTTLKVFNTLGQEVATLVDEQKQAGTYAVQWNAANVPSGVYFYRLQSGTSFETKKLILLR